MKKVAIVGAQELTRNNAPFEDESFEIWSISDWILSDWLKRCDVLIEIHQSGQYMNHPRTPRYWNTLLETDIPVYMYPVPDPRLKKARPYPLDGVLGMVSTGSNQGKAFKPLNSSIAYAMALAIYQGYEQIDVYGVELAAESEYAQQRHIFAFWAGVAAAKGIKLNVNCSDGLLSQPLYGFEDTAEREKISAMMKEVRRQKDDAEQVKLMAEGALQFAQALLEEK